VYSSKNPKARQERAWLYNRNAEFVGSDEVSAIEGDDRPTAGCHCKLKKQVVLGIREDGSPKVEDSLKMGD
jgi:hypothetical protein